MKAFNRNNAEKSHGFTLMEIVIAIAIIGILSAIAVPTYISHRYEGKIGRAISDIDTIESAVLHYIAEEGELPDSLSDINIDIILDPWGRPYQYLRIDGGTSKDLKGLRRRDKNANPVNSDFDLYSMGKDGKTAAQFTAKNARDDIVRANDGRYIGLAENH
jgi:general secretion pathway protein G